MFKQENISLLTQIESPQRLVESPVNEFVIIVFCYEGAGLVAVKEQ